MTKLATAVLLALCAASTAMGKIVDRPVDYSDKDVACHGFIIFDDATKGQRPTVIVLPDWRGVTDYAKMRGDMLAKLGYTAFIADIYGKDLHDKTPKEWSQEMGPYKADRDLYRARAKAAYEACIKQPEVDPAKVAAIGYCFGGTGVIEMARDGLPLLGVVSFHGGLDSRPLSPGAAIKARVLALCGADDPFEKPEDMKAFEMQMRDEKVDYHGVKYKGAVHAFTEKDVDAQHIPGAKYNAEADKASWQAMRDFLKKIFGA